MVASLLSAPEPHEFPPGTLFARTTAVTERARQRHALQPIATHSFTVEENGIPFLVRMLAGTGDDAASGQQLVRRAGTAPVAANPFLPYDPELFVADLSPTHVCLLNKFTVIDHHLLIVTRAFEAQEARLTVADFAATWLCLGEIDGLAFYNAGKVAGASQTHRHVQLAPFPLGPDNIRIPIERAFAAESLSGGFATVGSLPFAHVLAPIDLRSFTTLETAATASHALYLAMLDASGTMSSSGGDPPPYNLLVTRQWMLLVPRTCEAYDDMSVNALGFAGCLLVRNETQLQRLSVAGPLAALRHVGRPFQPLRKTVD